jgi:uronate dehydrogenase
LNLLMTGAAGAIGRVLRQGIAGHHQLRLHDREDPGPCHPTERIVQGDLADLELLEEAMKDVEVVIHLAAIPIEASFNSILKHNIVGTYNVFEAARRQRVRRVVFASTNHVVGFYSVAETVDTRAPVRPDTYYAVSKVAGEALGRLYHEKWGLEVVCLRIGSFRPKPTTLRELSTWLSHGDAVRLFTGAVEAPDVGHLIVYGVSANRRAFWSNQGAAGVIGYEPQDDAEEWADLVSKQTDEADRFHGGVYTRPEHIGGF